jgi:hypothetical protein
MLFIFSVSCHRPARPMERGDETEKPNTAIVGNTNFAISQAPIVLM